MDKSIHTRDVIARLKQLWGVDLDKDVYARWGIARSTLDYYKTKGYIPSKALRSLAGRERVSFEWLAYGHGAPGTASGLRPQFYTPEMLEHIGFVAEDGIPYGGEHARLCALLASMTPEQITRLRKEAVRMLAEE